MKWYERKFPIPKYVGEDMAIPSSEAHSLALIKKLYEEIRGKDAEIARLRAALAPILTHADSPDTAPPLRLSVEDCKKIKEMVNGK